MLQVGANEFLNYEAKCHSSPVTRESYVYSTLYKRRKNNWATRTDGEGERDKGLYFQEDPLKGT